MKKYYGIILIFAIIATILILYYYYNYLHKVLYGSMNFNFYTNPYNYTVNYSNNTLYLYLNDIQLPEIYTNQFILNISGVRYNLSCNQSILYINQSTRCYSNNVNLTSNDLIQLLYKYSNVLYDIELKYN
ncbi:hypothetical protein MJ1_0564 [Nanobdella aerobiophila]|uniref:Uncharacterized protein n=1 Tax=Nanobdella aerobiophila TaxID=2586965 RepID=A0A915WRX2_9ARCH|nr:hypothetical protein [Nanobdella aerobiophila]BBL45714.1 hypothetical protein MJ1_0564 [Nanobdella aerobiophila]